MTPPLPRTGLPPKHPASSHRRRPLVAVLARVVAALALALGAAPTTRAADKDPTPMPAPVPPAVAKSVPERPAIDLAIPRVVRTATFALG